jgi:hypothetical protein
MRRLRWHYFIEGMRFSYTARAFSPDGWCGFCGGKAEFTRRRYQARWWIVRRSWRIAADDARLDRLLFPERAR